MAGEKYGNGFPTISTYLIGRQKLPPTDQPHVNQNNYALKSGGEEPY